MDLFGEVIPNPLAEPNVRFVTISAQSRKLRNGMAENIAASAVAQQNGGQMTDDPQWYCVRTKPKHEKLSSTSLRSEMGLEVFCPFIRFERARTTGRTWVTEAMFPCYVFAKFAYVSQYRRVQAARGVINIVSFGGIPSVVPKGVIADLRSAVKDEETILIEPSVEVGEEVNVVQGPFKGLRAVVTRVMPARQRVAVLLEVLGMEREVEVETRTVLPDLPHPMAND